MSLSSAGSEVSLGVPAMPHPPGLSMEELYKLLRTDEVPPH
jgi:hypothetical protein